MALNGGILIGVLTLLAYTSGISVKVFDQPLANNAVPDHDDRDVPMEMDVDHRERDLPSNLDNVLADILTFDNVEVSDAHDKADGYDDLYKVEGSDAIDAFDALDKAEGFDALDKADDYDALDKVGSSDALDKVGSSDALDKVGSSDALDKADDYDDLYKVEGSDDQNNSGPITSMEREEDVRTYTVGRTRCRKGHKCGFHGYKYSWCWTDHAKGWGYCCTNRCAQHGYGYLWCKSGNTWAYCGDAGTTTPTGQSCRRDYPCGLHGGKNYWCYTGHSGSWKYCCAPRLVNSKHVYGCHTTSYRWCWASYKTKKWAHCVV